VAKSRECFSLRNTRQMLVAEATDTDVSIRWLTLGGALLEHASDVAVAERRTRDISIRRCCAEARAGEARDRCAGAAMTNAVRQHPSW
jgi:hypothetical protein